MIYTAVMREGVARSNLLGDLLFLANMAIGEGITQDILMKNKKIPTQQNSLSQLQAALRYE